MEQQKHDFLASLESLPPKCGGQLDDGSGVCTLTMEKHELPSRHYLVGERVPLGAPLTVDPVTGKARPRRSSDFTVMMGHAVQEMHPGDVIWLFCHGSRTWKVLGFAQTHVFIPDKHSPTHCASVRDSGQGLCGDPEKLHIPFAISTEKNPYVDIETRRLAKNMRQDMEAAQKMADEYLKWSRMKDSTENNRNVSRQHAQVWQARAHALKLALSGLE